MSKNQPTESTQKFSLARFREALQDQYTSAANARRAVGKMRGMWPEADIETALEEVVVHFGDAVQEPKVPPSHDEVLKRFEFKLRCGDYKKPADGQRALSKMQLPQKKREAADAMVADYFSKPAEKRKGYAPGTVERFEAEIEHGDYGTASDARRAISKMTRWTEKDRKRALRAMTNHFGEVAQKDEASATEAKSKRALEKIKRKAAAGKYKSEADLRRAINMVPWSGAEREEAFRTMDAYLEERPTERALLPPVSSNTAAARLTGGVRARTPIDLREAVSAMREATEFMAKLHEQNQSFRSYLDLGLAALAKGIRALGASVPGGGPDEVLPVTYIHPPTDDAQRIAQLERVVSKLVRDRS